MTTRTCGEFNDDLRTIIDSLRPLIEEDPGSAGDREGILDRAQNVLSRVDIEPIVLKYAAESRSMRFGSMTTINDILGAAILAVKQARDLVQSARSLAAYSIEKTKQSNDHPKQYLAIWLRESDGQRRWTVISQGSPLMADTENREAAVRVFRHHFPNADPIPLWDGELGDFIYG